MTMLKGQLYGLMLFVPSMALLAHLGARPHASTLSLDCTGAPGANIIPLQATIDLDSGLVTYAYFDDLKTKSGPGPSGTVYGDVTTTLVAWVGDSATDLDTRRYYLDRRTNRLTETEQENFGQKRFVEGEWICTPTS